MRDWLYELPLWIPAGLALVGLILIWTGFHRLEKRMKLIGLGMLGFALIIGLASWFLETDREIAIRQTREVIKAIEKRDWNTFGKLLHPDAEVLVWQGKDKIITLAKENAERYDVRNVRIISLEAEKSGKSGPTVMLHLRIFAEAQGTPTGFIDWQLEWERSGDAVLLRSADPAIDPGIISNALRGR